jgi:hypothetical protein
MLRKAWPLLVVSWMGCMPLSDGEPNETQSMRVRADDPITPAAIADDDERTAARTPGAIRSGDAPVPADCGIGDPEPNDTRDVALQYDVGSSVYGCIESNQDVDFYEFLSPDDNPAGGYVQFTLTEVGRTKIGLTFYSPLDNAIIDSGSAGESGADLDFYLALAPLGAYRMAISGNGADLSRYTLTSKYTAIDDPYEPNDTQEQAVPINAGEPVEAYFFGFHEATAIGRRNFYDWYEVTLRDGSVDVVLTEVPLHAYGKVSLHDANGKTLASNRSKDMGSNASIQAMVGAGSYLVRTDVSADYWDDRDAVPDPAAPTSTLPDNFTRRYILKVDQ